MITIDEQLTEANVYRDKVLASGALMYLVKISFLDARLFISGITVQLSPKQPETGWWVQMPRTAAGGGRWYKPFEIDTNSELWQLIESKAILAVQAYIKEAEEIKELAPDLGDMQF